MAVIWKYICDARIYECFKSIFFPHISHTPSRRFPTAIKSKAKYRHGASASFSSTLYIPKNCHLTKYLTFFGIFIYSFINLISDFLATRSQVLSKPQHSPAVSRRPCCAVALRITAWSEHGMASVHQTRPYGVNQMGKTYSKPLAARHGRGTACYVCESAFSRLVSKIHHQAM